MRCMVAWSRSSAGGAAASPGDTQRRFDFALGDFAFDDFAFEAFGFAARLCAFATRLGAAARLALPRDSGFTATLFGGASFGAGAATGTSAGAAITAGAATGGRGGTRELDV